jgi:hypothetical protein
VTVSVPQTLAEHVVVVPTCQNARFEFEEVERLDRPEHVRTLPIDPTANADSFRPAGALSVTAGPDRFRAGCRW